MYSALIEIGLKQYTYICFEAIQNSSKLISAPGLNRGLSWIFFSGWEVQTMRSLQKNLWYELREVCFNQKMFMNVLNMGLLESKRQFMEWKKNDFTKKKKFQILDGDADNILKHKKTHHYWLPWKRAIVNSASLLPTP